MKKKKKKESDAVQDGVEESEMDANVTPIQEEEWDGTEEMRKRKLDEYMDEIYGLDFNDMVSMRLLSVLIPRKHSDIRVRAGRRYANSLQVRQSRTAVIFPDSCGGADGDGRGAELLHGHQEICAV